MSVDPTLPPPPPPQDEPRLIGAKQRALERWVSNSIHPCHAPCLLLALELLVLIWLGIC